MKDKNNKLFSFENHFIPKIISWVGVLTIPMTLISIWGIGKIVEMWDWEVFLAYLCVCLTILIYLCLGISSKCDSVERELNQEFEKLSSSLSSEYSQLIDQTKKRKTEIDSWDFMRQQFLESKEPFKYTATMLADMRVIIYERAASYLKYKKHPSKKSAEVVLDLKRKTREYIAQYKQMEYKYEMLLNAFPMLREYDEEDDELSLIEMTKAESLEEVAANRDIAMDFLSKEEWQRMSTSQRNQLALDRWKKGSKSNWTIGMLYEMYAAYCLRVNQKASWSQFEIIPFGINEGRADLGRDLIVKYNPTLFDDNKFTMGNPEPITWVMQCKRWKKERVIRENVICQLYGTTIEYKLKNNPKEKVVPMLVTTTDLSDMAKRFAEALGVVVKVLPYEDFPMIKCNINNGQKIYHLPFDQQYWRTNIDRPGEFYAMTVEEAEKAGFRRAFKHFVGKA